MIFTHQIELGFSIKCKMEVFYLEQRTLIRYILHGFFSENRNPFNFDTKYIYNTIFYALSENQNRNFQKFIAKVLWYLKVISFPFITEESLFFIFKVFSSIKSSLKAYSYKKKVYSL